MTKTALITGATGGLGSEFARLFARNGYGLVLVGRSEEKLALLAEELRNTFVVEVACLATDLAAEGAAARVAGFTEAQHIQVDVLVNNAGFGDYGDFASVNLDRQTEMVNLNVRTLMELTYWYLGPMLDRGSGKVLNLASIAGFMPGPKMSVYFASKAFVLSFSEALSEELKGTGVSCTALCPGPTATSFWNVADAADKGMFAKTAYATPEEVARFGYDSLMAGKVVAVPGLSNVLMTTAAKILPRSLVRSVVHMMLS